MADDAALESHTDAGLGAEGPAIHRFTRAVERAKACALADHHAGRCANSEWSCSHCEAEDLRGDQRKPPVPGATGPRAMSVPTS